MVGALAFVLVRSVRGRTVQMARRLKEPRYLFGFLVGAGWILFWAGRFFIGTNWSTTNFQFGPTQEILQAAAGPIGQALQVILATLLAIGGILWWAVPFGRNSLEFTEPELHLLLPSPVPRRALIQYGVLKSQPGVLIGVVITAFFMGPGTFWGSAATLLALWLFFSLWDLHAKGRGLWYAQLHELAPAARWRWQIMLWLLLLGALITVAVLALQLGLEIITRPLPDFEAVAELLESAETFGEAAWNSPLASVLTPIIWLLQPFFRGIAGDLGFAWVVTLAFPAALLFVHNEWVVRSQSRFEETALAQAKKRNKQAKGNSNFWRRTRARRGWATFPLPPAGRPETAILWKNLMLVQRLPLTVALAAPTALLVALLAMIAVGILPVWLAIILQLIGLIVMLATPLFNARAARNDFRADLLRLEIMRTMPIGGVRMFLAEISAPVSVAMLQVLFGVIVFMGIDTLNGLGWIGGDSSASVNGSRVVFLSAEAMQAIADYLHVNRLALVPLAVAGYLPIALAVTSLTASLENIAALAFPGWVQLGTTKKQAASKVGQHVLVFMALSIVMFAGLLPGVLTVGAVVAVQVLVWNIPLSAWELPVLGLAGALPIGAVVVALAVLGGRLWDRLDPSAEMLAGGN